MEVFNNKNYEHQKVCMLAYEHTFTHFANSLEAARTHTVLRVRAMLKCEK